MILLKNARVFDGKELNEESADVLLKGTTIEKIAPSINMEEGMQVIDLDGKYLPQGLLTFMYISEILVLNGEKI